MSRRKQTKPQHLKSDLESPLAAIAYENAPCEEKDSADNSDEETHVCERCRVPFSGWPNLCEHQKNCTMSPAVLALSEDEVIPPSQESPAGLSPAPSCISEAANSDHTEESYTLTTAGVSALRLGSYDAGEDEGPQEVLRLPEKADDLEQPADWGESAISLPQISTASSEVSYDRPNTNVTLETLHSTRVAVAQFSQVVHTGSASGSTAMAIPRILEQLMTLQQQQIHQLQLIELIRGQVATMNKQPTLSALAMAADSTSAPSQSQLKGFISPPVHPSLTMMPVLVNGEASVSKTSSLEQPQSHNFQPASRQSNPGMSTCTSVSASCSPPPSNNNMESSLLPHYTNTSNSCPQELNSLSPLSLGHGNMTDLSSNMPLPPQSSSSTVIFPNPLASIVATTNALDTLSVVMKHRRGKPSNVSMLDTKPRAEDSFFKHKCRFCAKVFGSDSALQIHLRSHTGERPFKCNICGNRFSTKGNLKVHFQRHKEKHPHIQMNPNPVPEYLDNMPTSSGVPYGMSFPPEKPATTWLDCKPVLPTVPTSVGLQLPSPLSTVGGYSGSPNLTPLNRSPQRPSPPSSECASLSPHLDRGTPTAKDSTLFWKDPSIDLKQEGTHLPKNYITGLGEKPPSVVGQPSTVTETHVLVDTVTTTTDTTSSSAPSTVYNPMRSMMSDQFKVKFPFGGVLDSMQTSETSKLQQLVENIDKKITDPNQCVICHRVLSCQSALKMHYRIHTGERPFKCKVCGRAFTTKGNLKTHFGVHRSKPPLRIQHSCPICQKKFTNAVVLQQHIRMHMGGQIPNTPLQEDVQDMDPGFSFNVEKGFSAISNYDDELMDDNCMEDETEPMEGDISCCSTSAIPSQPIISIIAALEKQTRSVDSTEGSEHFTNDQESYSEGPSAISESSSYTQALSPSHSQSESLCSKSPGVDNAQVFPDGEVTAKSEKQESSPVALDLIAFQPGMSVIKEETPLRTLVLSKEHGLSQITPSPVTTTASSFITFEINGHSKPVSTSEGPRLRFGVPIPAVPQAAMSPGVPYTLAPPQPRRTSKQHNCHSCGKNFSSASALQIHERTHTGEKPFGCSVCGRAFTTKGNLKVHMGTHVWSNTPARRGRRLSVENPLTLLGGNAMKFSEMFQKDQAVRAINLAPGFWTQYATAITNSLTMKSKEISAFQNGGVSQLPISLGGLGGGIPCLGGLLVGMDKACTGNTSPMMSLENTNTEVRAGHHFSRFIEDNKGIEIN